MTTTPEEREKVKKFFEKKIEQVSQQINSYANNLFPNVKTITSDIWSKASEREPFQALHYLACLHNKENYELFYGISMNVIEDEGKIDKIQASLNEIANNTHTDISSMKTDLTELQKSMLPAAKGMIKLIDKFNEEEERRKKNGEAYIA